MLNPEECVSAIVERGRDARALLVVLRRADGQDVPIHVASTEQAIELLREMNPERIYLAVQGEALAELTSALGDGVTYRLDAPQVPTLH